MERQPRRKKVFQKPLHTTSLTVTCDDCFPNNVTYMKDGRVFDTFFLFDIRVGVGRVANTISSLQREKKKSQRFSVPFVCLPLVCEVLP